MTTQYTPPRHILPVIVVAQFACTSLWFAGNAVLEQMATAFGFAADSVAHLTSAVQIGFITGTLTFALLTIADRFSPSKVFLASALLGAAANVCALLPGNSFATLLLTRFSTGFFLAGIYPVGMKIASDYHRTGLGRALGYLVGALVVGTALPHGLRALTADLDWRLVLWGTSALAVAGGLAIYALVPDGPFRKAAKQVDPRAFTRVFADRKFRSAAFGYFGHMWELYSFWAFVPVMLLAYQGMQPAASAVSALSFIIIGTGGLSCIVGGYLALRKGSAFVAYWALILSGTCCVLAPLFFRMPPVVYIAFLVFWGIVVIADSPQFSTLVAGTAPQESIGTALTIVNCIGFAITIVSMQVISLLYYRVNDPVVFMLLGIGPALGILSMRSLYKVRA